MLGTKVLFQQIVFKFQVRTRTLKSILDALNKCDEKYKVYKTYTKNNVEFLCVLVLLLNDKLKTILSDYLTIL